jgi:hypothetical protein
MNRRSFFSRLAAVAALPLVKLRPAPTMPEFVWHIPAKWREPGSVRMTGWSLASVPLPQELIDDVVPMTWQIPRETNLG